MGKLGSLFLNVLTGGLADKLLGFMERREAVKLATMNDEQKRAYDERTAIRDDALAVRMATSTFWEMRLITFIIAACFTLHLVLVTLDTVLTGVSWNIPKLPAPFDYWEGIILTSFFGLTGTTMLARSAVSTAVLTRRNK